MEIRVRLFASYREAVGERELTVSLPSGIVTVAAVWARLRQDFPRLGALTHTPAAAINQEYASLSAEVRDGDEVAFLPPVSGG
jgi:molybdopterin synthase sulfur carrier subunit